ncbi:MAG: hypothetical protein LBQ91_00140 [Oscillospiraceae bacterium]|nr:hypothetical protein [Oscillospiraceae bacterium]
MRTLFDGLMAVYLLGVLAGVFLGVIFHELGHLFFGRLTGYHFVSFRLLNRLWVKDNEGKMTASKSAGLSGIAGQCLMSPCEEEREFRFVLYNLGSILANAGAGAAAAVLYVFTGNAYIRMALLGFGLVNLLLAALSYIPYKKAFIPNDGANVREARKSEAAEHGLYVLLKANAEMSKGKIMTDFPEGFFRSDGSADINNYLEANLIMLRSAQLEEAGMLQQSYEELLQLENARLPVFYSGQITLALMFHELVYFEGAEWTTRARARIEARTKDKNFQKLLKMKHPAFMPFSAAKTAFLDCETDKAREQIDKARELTAALRNPGQEHTVTQLLDRLTARL